VHIISAVVIIGAAIALIVRHRNYQPETPQGQTAA